MNQVYYRGGKSDPSTQKKRAITKSARKGVMYDDLPGVVPDNTPATTITRNVRTAKDPLLTEAPPPLIPTPLGIQSIVPLFLEPSMTKQPPPTVEAFPVLPPSPLKFKSQSNKGKKKGRGLTEKGTRDDSQIQLVTEQPPAAPQVDPARAGIVSAPIPNIKFFRSQEDDWSSDSEDLPFEGSRLRQVNVPAPLAVSIWNIHLKLLLLSFPPSLCFIAFFIFLLITSSASTSVVSDSTSRNNLPGEVTAVLSAMETEMLAAADLLGPLQTAMRSYSYPPPTTRQISYNETNANIYNFSIFAMPDGVKDFLTSGKVDFLRKVAATQGAVGRLVAFYSKRPEAFSTEGYSLIRDGLQFTRLDRARNSVVGSGDLTTIFGAYADAAANLIQFTGLVQLRSATVDPRDLVEMERSFAIAQWSHTTALGRLLRLKRNSGPHYIAACTGNGSVPCQTPFMAPIDDFGEYSLLWQSEAAITIYEQFLRYAGSSQSRINPTSIKSISPSSIGVFSSTESQQTIPYRTRTGTQSLTVPSSCSNNDGLIPTSLLRESVTVKSDTEWLMMNRSGTVYGFGFVDAKRRASYYSQWLGNSRQSFSDGLQSNAYIRLRVGLVIQYVFLSLGAFAILIGIANVVYDSQQRDRSAAINSETKVLTKSLARMKLFAEAVSKFESNRVQDFVARFTRSYGTDTNPEQGTEELNSLGNATPAVESSLYKCFSQFKDLEPHLPQTLLYPPKRLASTVGFAFPTNSLPTRLLLKPSMAYQRGLVALRVSLSDFHSQFSQSATRQKTSHHELQQLLALLQLFASVASSTMSYRDAPGGVRPSPLLTLYPDHIILWMNISGDISYPCLRATLIAKLLLREARERLRNKHPAIVVAAGDAFVGHVSNQLPQSDPLGPGTGGVRVVPHTCFTAVGPLIETLERLALIAEAQKASHTLVASSLQGGQKGDSRGRVYASDSSASVSATSKTTGSQLSDAHDATFGGTGGTSPCLLFDNAAAQLQLSEAQRIHDDDYYINGDWVPAEQPTGPTPAPMTNRIKNRDAAGASFKAAKLRAAFIYKNYLKDNRCSALVEGAALVLPKIINSFLNEDKAAAADDEDNALVRAAIARAIENKHACSFISFCNENNSAKEMSSGAEARGQSSKAITGQYVFRVLLELFASNHGAGTNTNNNRLKVTVGQSAVDTFSQAMPEGNAATQIGSFLWAALSLKDTHPQQALPQQTGGGRVFFAPEVDAQARAKKRALGTLNINVFINRASTSVVAAEQMLSSEEFELLLPEVALYYAPVEIAEVPLPPAQMSDPFIMSSGQHTSPSLRAHIGTMPAQWFVVADGMQTADGALSKVVLCPMYSETILTEVEELSAWKLGVSSAVASEGLVQDPAHFHSFDPLRAPYSIPLPPLGAADEPVHRLQWLSFASRVSSELQGAAESKCETLGAMYSSFARLRRAFDPIRAKVLLHVLQWLKHMLLISGGTDIPIGGSGRVSRVGGAVVPPLAVFEAMMAYSANLEMIKLPLESFVPMLFDPSSLPSSRVGPYFDSPQTVAATFGAGSPSLHHIHDQGGVFGIPAVEQSISRPLASQLLTVVATIDRMTHQILKGLLTGTLATSDQEATSGFIEAALW